MLESDAIRALPKSSWLILCRIICEHLGHGGRENGNLKVTYDQFVAFGVSRSLIAPGIALLSRVGLIDVSVRGLRSHGIARRPNSYRLTWLPRADEAPATNRWKGYIASRRQVKSNLPGSKTRTIAGSKTEP